MALITRENITKTKYVKTAKKRKKTKSSEKESNLINAVPLITSLYILCIKYKPCKTKNKTFCLLLLRL